MTCGKNWTHVIIITNQVHWSTTSKPSPIGLKGIDILMLLLQISFALEDVKSQYEFGTFDYIWITLCFKGGWVNPSILQVCFKKVVETKEFFFVALTKSPKPNRITNSLKLCKPLSGWVKLNIDGSSFENQGQHVGEFCLRMVKEID